jgi:8-oxo-dGTP pyrophosphatase MutT (NUDIX family)
LLDDPIVDALGEGTPDSPRLVVETWMAVPTRGGLKVLLLRRGDDHGGFWQGVSGCVEAVDGTLRRAAEREIAEETGIQGGYEICDLGLWHEFEGVVSGASFRKRTLGTLLPSGTSVESIRLSEEHVEARLVSFDEARTLVRFEENVAELSALEKLIYED